MQNEKEDGARGRRWPRELFESPCFPPLADDSRSGEHANRTRFLRHLWTRQDVACDVISGQKVGRKSCENFVWTKRTTNAACYPIEVAKFYWNLQPTATRSDVISYSTSVGLEVKLEYSGFWLELFVIEFENVSLRYRQRTTKNK